MGLIKELVLLPVAPLRGTLWVADRVADQVEQEQYSGGAAVRELDQIEGAKESGDLDEKEAAERQDEVIEQQLVRAAEPTTGGEG